MHGVRASLLHQQAEQMNAELRIVGLPPDCPNEEYNRRMSDTLEDLVREGYDRVVFGDVFLEDVRDYRESQMESHPVECAFPLWGGSTETLSEEFINRGYRAVVVCVDPETMDDSYLGRPYDRSFLEDLPDGVDPCGENGEFHTFVYDGPLFSGAVEIQRGEIVERDGFLFRDFMPGRGATS